MMYNRKKKLPPTECANENGIANAIEYLRSSVHQPDIRWIFYGFILLNVCYHKTNENNILFV